MRNIFIHLRRKLLATFFIGLSALQVFAQPNPHWTAGKSSSFANLFSKAPLQITGHIMDLAFVKRVGGVSFGGVATPASGTHFSKLNLTYAAHNGDGYRLKIILDDHVYTVYLPDWELLPIARYANSDYAACVTLFGKESTWSHSHIQYHEAFLNSLLGMRILQSDIIFEDLQEFYKVFQFGGSYVLGHGERMPDADKSARAASRMYALLNTYDPDQQHYDSYVLTDENVKIEFTANSNGFSIKGYPYYFFFKYGEKAPLPYYSMIEAFKNNYADIYAMNPLVYSAVTRTMQYAAFFRYVKNNYSREWRSFISSMDNIAPSPAVTTPTSMEK
jgi:hypothetical protein